MKFFRIRDGMKLKGVGDYADGHIEVGGQYEAILGASGKLEIACTSGQFLDLSTAVDEDGDIPELEPTT